MSILHFKNREEAGARLADSLLGYRDNPDTLILGLARGGVVIAAALREKLHILFHPYIVRKIGCPGNEELAIGAIAEGGKIILNMRLLESLRITVDTLAPIILREKNEMRRRLQIYRANRPLSPLADKRIILTDDGVATGATMQVAVQDLKERRGAREVIIAVPVSSRDAETNLTQVADRFITLGSPADFQAVGQFYDRFPQVTDEEVLALLKH